MKIVKYVTIFILLTTIGMLYDRYIKKFFPDEELNKYNLVRKYLLNETDSVLGKPLLWIHTTHNINSRKWPSFYSRNTRQLNQPYKDLCVESIVKHCGDSFNICLIDDNSFSKLLKGWSIKVDELANPVRSHVRELALSNILYEYGGLLVPNSTIVLKDLKPLFDEKLLTNDFFAGEFVNKGSSNTYTRFFPSNKFMGCKKGSKGIRELLNDLETSVSTDNSDQPEFEGLTDRYIYKLVTEGKCGLICGKALGTKDKKDNVILIENWLEEGPVDLCMCSLYCICLPDDEILHRTKYGWFARLSHRQVMEGNIQASKYLILSHGI